MPLGVYKHKTGKESSHWKGGLPVCKICNKILSRRDAVACVKHAYRNNEGRKNGMWKGDSAGYSALHIWISSVLGKPRRCSFCGTTKAKKFEWANLSHKYKRRVDDWVRLCTKCHIKYDKSFK